MTRYAPLALLLLPTFACGPAEPEETGPVCAAGELSIEVGLHPAEGEDFVPLAEDDALVVDENESGQLVADLHVRVDGLSTSDTLTSVTAFLFGVPVAPDTPRLGQEGQGCIAEGAARECAELDLRCIGVPGSDVCLRQLGSSAATQPDFGCADDDALHQGPVRLSLLQNTPHEELEGYASELVLFLEREPTRVEEARVLVTLDVAGVD